MRNTSRRSFRCGRPLRAYAFRSALLLSLLALCLATLSPAAPAAGEEAAETSPGETLAERFGVASSHLKLFDSATMEGELGAMEEAGAAWVRCDFAWSDLEPARGFWNFSGADEAVERAREHGVEVLGILGTSPPWANGGNLWNYPPTEEHIPDWRVYVSAVASRYRGEVAAWEIWNEQNIHAFWMPEPDSAYYVELLRAASEEIRAADPGATVVMGGVAGLGSDYLDQCLAAGAADYIDAIAYHPYPETIGVEGQPEEDTYRPKEELCRWLADGFLPRLVSLHTEKELEIWITELGWTTCEESPPGVDYPTQASYMLRSLINYAGTGVDRVIWYNIRDEEMDPHDYLGLLENDFTPKPSYAYYSTFTDVFGEAVPAPQDEAAFSCSDPSTLEAHCFELPDGGLAVGVWKSDDSEDSLAVTVNEPDFQEPLMVDPLTGERLPTPGISRDPEGRITVHDLPIGKNPVILEFNPDILSVACITPDQADQTAVSIEITDITGTGFQAGAQVRLELGDYIIEAGNVNVVSSSKITCTVGCFAVPTGGYDVVVRNPEGRDARLEGAFTVRPLCGEGAGSAVLMLGISLGLLSMTVSIGARKRLFGRKG